MLIAVIDRSDTQPTRARWDHLPDEEGAFGKRRILGGTKAGNGAWALAWVDTVMELPSDEKDEQAEARRKLWERATSDMSKSVKSAASREMSLAA